MIYGDRASFSIQIGSWIDTIDEPLRVAVVIPCVGVQMDDPSVLVTQLFEWKLNPWQYDLHEHSYFANASGGSFELVIALAPLLRDIAISGTASALAQYVLVKAISLIKSALTRDGTLTVEEALEVGKSLLVNHAGAAIPDLEQIKATIEDDGSCVLLIRDKRRRQDHLIVIDQRGITGYANLDAFDLFVERYYGPTENLDAAPGDQIP